MKPEIKKFVFRVANGNNHGPFANGHDRSILFHNQRKFYDSDVFPNFDVDGMRVTHHHIAAVPDACSLFHWFGEDLDLLHKSKFLVHRVEVKDMVYGTSNVQVAYHRKRDKVGKMQVVPIKYKGLLLLK